MEFFDDVGIIRGSRVNRHMRATVRGGVGAAEANVAEQVRKRERPVWMETEPLPGSAHRGNL